MFKTISNFDKDMTNVIFVYLYIILEKTQIKIKSKKAINGSK